MRTDSRSVDLPSLFMWFETISGLSIKLEKIRVNSSGKDGKLRGEKNQVFFSLCNIHI